MAQITSLKRREAGLPLTEHNSIIFLKRIANPFLKIATGSKIKYRLKRENIYHAIQKQPIIFVVNHSRFQDTPLACKAVKKHSYVLAGVQKLPFLDEFFFHANGSIFVDRKDKKDMALSKEAMEEYLKKGQSLIVFPEGTWNLSDSLMVMEMKWGIVDVAKDTNAQIIPLSLDYDQESMICYARFGTPILVQDFDDKLEAIGTIRDAMATLRWEQMEKYPTLSRKDEKAIAILRKRKWEICKEYPCYDYDYEQSIIFHSSDSPEEVFAPIKKLEPNRQNAFLFDKRNKGYW